MVEVFSAGAYKRNFEKLDSFNARIQHLLSYATRAPSTHNSQPWKFSIASKHLTLLRDESIQLPESDSAGRYRYISFGYLLHHILLLAAYNGMHATLFFGKDPIVAKIEFSEPSGIFDARLAPLVNALCVRRNRRGVFENIMIPQDTLETALLLSPLFPNTLPKPETAYAREKVIHIASQTAEGIRRAYRSSAFRREMASWITPTGSWKKTGLPGYSLNQPMILSWVLPTLIRFVNIGGFLAKLNFASVSSAPCVLGFSSDDAPRAWLGVGFQASHAALTFVAAGFDVSVYVASLEYSDTRQEVTRVFGLSRQTQFLFVAGKLKGVVSWRTPRVPVSKKFTGA